MKLNRPDPRSLEERLNARGVNRREFLKFCTLMAGVLALPRGAAAMIAKKLVDTRPAVLWLEFQGCTGDTESFLRSSTPDVATILLETISLNYHETLMWPSGDLSLLSLEETLKDYPGRFIAVIEGSIPAANNGVYCCIGGRTGLSIVREVCASAAATIAVGSCASFGGLPAASPNPTGALGVAAAVPGLTNYVNLPGCPANVVNIVGTIVYYLTNGQLPPVDAHKRPTFAYPSPSIHSNCPRRDNYRNNRFVVSWGDDGAQQGYCLFQKGCRGPLAHHNCPQQKWNDGTNWPIGAGHPCIGCAEPSFWDANSPFYEPGDIIDEKPAPAIKLPPELKKKSMLIK